MDPDEIEFIAECQTISVIPSFSKECVIHLISGDFGPFRAGYPQIVPLWLAVYLKQRRKCQIIPPDWMNLEILEEKKEEEKQSRYFTKMPSDHYMEMANILFDVCSEDIVNCDAVRTAIKDLWDIRISKLRSSVDMFIKTGGRHAQLNYLTQLEITSIRPLLPDSLNVLQQLTDQNPRERSSGVVSQMHNLSLILHNRTLQGETNSTVQDSNISLLESPSSSGQLSTTSPLTLGNHNLMSPSTSGSHETT